MKIEEEVKEEGEVGLFLREVRKVLEIIEYR